MGGMRTGSNKSVYSKQGGGGGNCDGEGRGGEGLTLGPADSPSLLIHWWGLPLSLEEACESLSPQSPLLAGPGPARD